MRSQTSKENQIFLWDNCFNDLMILIAICLTIHYLRKFFPQIIISEEVIQMEDQTINGTNDEIVVHQSVEKSVKFMANNNNNEENGDDDSHVIYAEISHESQEPIAFKRSLIPETNGQTDGTNGDNSEEVEEQKEEEVASIPTEAEPQTADFFIKMEEKNVIERLSRVIDTELSIETLRVDSESVADNKEEEDEEESKPEVESQSIESETEPRISELPEDTTDGSVFSRFSIAVNQETTEEENGLKVTETIETFTEYEIKTEERVENDIKEENHKPVIEDVVIKQNGRKTIYSSEEDLEEEEDGLPEIIGFKTTLKMWSTGKKTTGDDVPVIDPKDKFKTLRQIRKGNTRSLMEKFQAFKS